MKKILLVALVALLTMPCVVNAEEVEITLTEVISLQPLPGDSPLDDPEKEGSTPTRPTDFRATIDGNYLSINKRNDSIPSAQATVVNAMNGGIVLNQQFTNSVSQQISNAGVYVLHIETAGGALVGQFMVQ
ncbi:MAG: DUF3244 domain-containing protein [Paludibacteraceae bacterium]|nr:DUF3244 domain-containing protein [Paludibacteraceae bacterium]